MSGIVSNYYDEYFVMSWKSHPLTKVWFILIMYRFMVYSCFICLLSHITYNTHISRGIHFTHPPPPPPPLHRIMIFRYTCMHNVMYNFAPACTTECYIMLELVSNGHTFKADELHENPAPSLLNAQGIK